MRDNRLHANSALALNHDAGNGLELAKFGGGNQANPGGYPGMLPTLGLNKYKNVDLQPVKSNPYRVEATTEKLLVVKEREREFRGFNRMEKDAKRVFEKEMSSRPNRQGVIREIRHIKPAHSVSHTGLPGRGTQGNLGSLDDPNAQKARINIFSHQDPSLLRHENLAKLSYEDAPLVPVNRGISDSRSASQMSVYLEPIVGKPKAIDYLNRSSEGRESVKDYINFSRQILMSQISINAKTEENLRLKEYIQMEQEKLDEARRFLEEDREKFEKLMNDSDKMVKQVDGEVKRKLKEKAELAKEIDKYAQEIQQKDGAMKKFDDDLVQFKRDKHFLDILAIQAGLKKYQQRDNEQERRAEI